MYTVDLYRRVRLACHVEGLSQRKASKRFGIARETVKKMLLHSEPPGYRRREPSKRPKLDPFTVIIDRILEEDRSVRRKQRHTATSGYSSVLALSMALRAGEPSSRITFGNSVNDSGRCSCRWRILQAMPRQTLARRT